VYVGLMPRITAVYLGLSALIQEAKMFCKICTKINVMG